MSEQENEYHCLNHVSVIDVCGADAGAIINNLTTNEVLNLEVGQGRETFVTDVRGKTVGHICLYRQSDFIRLIGPGGQTERIAQHVDRYTIREDATAVNRDADFSAIAMSAASVSAADIQTSIADPIGWATVQLAGRDVAAYRTRWLGEKTTVLLIPKREIDCMTQLLANASLVAGDDARFQMARMQAEFPWYGCDLDETNLPQELDRDEVAISFTKGCYLGQETVARLDALGQVQRKLVRWSIDGAVPQTGTTLSDDGKTVGRLTSVAAVNDGQSIALGFARRSHFEPGATATGTDPATGAEFTATVV